MKTTVEERRLLTILFADLSGFTALSSTLDPEDVREVANTGFEILGKPIIKEGGTIHKYEGDLMIALFGFPVTHEDDPERAIRAALEMLELVPDINKILSKKLKKETELGLHIGINSGTVVVGEVGFTEKREYTIMGDAVNLTARLKDVAKAGEVVVAESVFRASRYMFNYEACPPVSVKGISEPVRVFRPLAIKDKPEPKRGIKDLFSPMVGRDKELNMLKQAVDKLKDGQGGAFFIFGGAGLGKSRLLAELKNSLDQNQKKIKIFEGRCLSYGENVPYWPFLRILQNIFDITEQDTPEMIQGNLLKKVRDILPDAWAEVLPYVGYLFTVHLTDELDEKIKYLDSKNLKLQIFASVRTLLTKLAASTPILLIVEDYHWIDKESLELLEFIFDRELQQPILLLALSRPEKDKECYKTKANLKKRLGKHCHEIQLKPLDSKASSQLVYNILKIAGITEQFKDKILAKAEGNPFYVEEIIRSLIDSSLLLFTSGVWHLATDIDSITIPDTVQSTIAARLDRLEQDARNVLQMASVMGRNFYVSVLEYLAKTDSLMLTLHLATLEDYEYINETKRHPELQYVFRHPLLQEVTYNSLLKKKRKELHRRTAEAIEIIFKDRLDDFAEVLAHQYVNSDNISKATEWLKKAGARAKERYANDEAKEYFKMLVGILKEETTGQETELRSAYESLGDICYTKSEYDSAIKYFKAMEQLTGDDKIMQSRARRKISDSLQKQHKNEEAFEILVEAEKLLPGYSEQELLEKAKIYISKSWIQRIRGQLDEAISHGAMALATIDIDRPNVLDERGLKLFKAQAFNSLGSVYYVKGEINRAIELNEKHLRLSEEVNDKRDIGVASNNLGNAYSDIGNFDKAIELYERSLKIAGEIGYRRGVAIANGNLGIVYIERGEYEKALEFFRQEKKVSEDLNDKMGIASADYKIGVSYLEMRKINEVEEYLVRALDRYKEGGDIVRLIDIYTKLADTKIAQGASEKEINDLLAKAWKLLEGADLKSSLATFYLTKCRLSATMGNFKEAEENFERSIKFFDEAGQKKYLADAYCEYARVIKIGIASGVFSSRTANEYYDKALAIYQELKLLNKVRDIEEERNL